MIDIYRFYFEEYMLGYLCERCQNIIAFPGRDNYEKDQDEPVRIDQNPP